MEPKFKIGDLVHWNNEALPGKERQECVLEILQNSEIKVVVVLRDEINTDSVKDAVVKLNNLTSKKTFRPLTEMERILYVE